MQSARQDVIRFTAARFFAFGLNGALALTLFIVGVLLPGCRGCGDRDTVVDEELTASETAVAGEIDAGTVAATTDGPWTIGIALFDELAFVPDTLEALDEPSLWETYQADALPSRFSVDLGAPFRGWVVVILDDDGSGLPGTPEAGDLVGVAAGVVEAPAPDLKVYLEEIWER